MFLTFQEMFCQWKLKMLTAENMQNVIDLLQMSTEAFMKLAIHAANQTLQTHGSDDAV